jgi:hypothetical protein
MAITTQRSGSVLYVRFDIASVYGDCSLADVSYAALRVFCLFTHSTSAGIYQKNRLPITIGVGKVGSLLRLLVIHIGDTPPR